MKILEISIQHLWLLLNINLKLKRVSSSIRPRVSLKETRDNTVRQKLLLLQLVSQNLLLKCILKLGILNKRFEWPENMLLILLKKSCADNRCKEINLLNRNCNKLKLMMIPEITPKLFNAIYKLLRLISRTINFWNKFGEEPFN